MATTYKGESVGKKVTRLLFWADTMDKISNWETSPKMVLASGEAGDVSTLLGLGADPSSIIGVDTDEEALKQARYKFPDILFLQGDVEEIAKKYRSRLGVLHLDFCGPLHKGLMDKVLRCASSSLKSEALLGCAFMYGRELGLASRLVTMTQHRCEDRKNFVAELLSKTKTAEELIDNLRATGVYALQDVADRFESDGDSLEEIARALKNPSSSFELWLDRVESLTAYMNEEGTKLRCAPYLLRAYRYHSRTNKNRGVPMMYYLGRIYRPSERQIRTSVFIKKFFEAMEREKVDPEEEMGWHTTEEKFRRFAVMQARRFGSARAGLQLNLSPGTLAAWLAHDTRKRRENGLSDLEG